MDSRGMQSLSDRLQENASMFTRTSNPAFVAQNQEEEAPRARRTMEEIRAAMSPLKRTRIDVYGNVNRILSNAVPQMQSIKDIAEPNFEQKDASTLEGLEAMFQSKEMLASLGKGLLFKRKGTTDEAKEMEALELYRVGFMSAAEMCFKTADLKDFHSAATVENSPQHEAYRAFWNVYGNGEMNEFFAQCHDRCVYAPSGEIEDVVCRMMKPIAFWAQIRTELAALANVQIDSFTQEKQQRLAVISEVMFKKVGGIKIVPEMTLAEKSRALADKHVVFSAFLRDYKQALESDAETGSEREQREEKLLQRTKERGISELSELLNFRYEMNRYMGTAVIVGDDRTQETRSQEEDANILALCSQRTSLAQRYETANRELVGLIEGIGDEKLKGRVKDYAEQIDKRRLMYRTAEQGNIALKIAGIRTKMERGGSEHYEGERVDEMLHEYHQMFQNATAMGQAEQSYAEVMECLSSVLKVEGSELILSRMMCVLPEKLSVDIAKKNVEEDAQGALLQEIARNEMIVTSLSRQSVFDAVDEKGIIFSPEVQELAKSKRRAADYEEERRRESSEAVKSKYPSIFSYIREFAPKQEERAKKGKLKLDAKLARYETVDDQHGEEANEAMIREKLDRKYAQYNYAVIEQEMDRDYSDVFMCEAALEAEQTIGGIAGQLAEFFGGHLKGLKQSITRIRTNNYDKLEAAREKGEEGYLKALHKATLDMAEGLHNFARMSRYTVSMYQQCKISAEIVSQDEAANKKYDTFLESLKGTMPTNYKFPEGVEIVEAFNTYYLQFSSAIQLSRDMLDQVASSESSYFNLYEDKKSKDALYKELHEIERGLSTNDCRYELGLIGDMEKEKRDLIFIRECGNASEEDLQRIAQLEDAIKESRLVIADNLDAQRELLDRRAQIKERLLGEVKLQKTADKQDIELLAKRTVRNAKAQILAAKTQMQSREKQGKELENVRKKRDEIAAEYDQRIEDFRKHYISMLESVKSNEELKVRIRELETALADKAYETTLKLGRIVGIRSADERQQEEYERVRDVNPSLLAVEDKLELYVPQDAAGRLSDYQVAGKRIEGVGKCKVLGEKITGGISSAALSARIGKHVNRFLYSRGITDENYRQTADSVVDSAGVFNDKLTGALKKAGALGEHGFAQHMPGAELLNRFMALQRINDSQALSEFAQHLPEEMQQGREGDEITLDAEYIRAHADMAKVVMLHRILGGLSSNASAYIGLDTKLATELANRIGAARDNVKLLYDHYKTTPSYETYCRQKFEGEAQALRERLNILRSEYEEGRLHVLPSVEDVTDQLENSVIEMEMSAAFATIQLDTAEVATGILEREAMISELRQQQEATPEMIAENTQDLRRDMDRISRERLSTKHEEDVNRLMQTGSLVSGQVHPQWELAAYADTVRAMYGNRIRRMSIRQLQDELSTMNANLISNLQWIRIHLDAQSQKGEEYASLQSVVFKRMAYENAQAYLGRSLFKPFSQKSISGMLSTFLGRRAVLESCEKLSEEIKAKAKKAGIPEGFENVLIRNDVLIEAYVNGNEQQRKILFENKKRDIETNLSVLRKVLVNEQAEDAYRIEKSVIAKSGHLFLEAKPESIQLLTQKAIEVFHFVHEEPADEIHSFFGKVRNLSENPTPEIVEAVEWAFAEVNPRLEALDAKRSLGAYGEDVRLRNLLYDVKFSLTSDERKGQLKKYLIDSLSYHALKEGKLKEGKEKAFRLLLDKCEEQSFDHLTDALEAARGESYSVSENIVIRRILHPSTYVGSAAHPIHSEFAAILSRDADFIANQARGFTKLLPEKHRLSQKSYEDMTSAELYEVSEMLVERLLVYEKVITRTDEFVDSEVTRRRLLEKCISAEMTTPTELMALAQGIKDKNENDAVSQERESVLPLVTVSFRKPFYADLMFMHKNTKLGVDQIREVVRQERDLAGVPQREIIFAGIGASLNVDPIAVYKEKLARTMEQYDRRKQFFDEKCAAYKLEGADKEMLFKLVEPMFVDEPKEQKYKWTRQQIEKSKPKDREYDADELTALEESFQKKVEEWIDTKSLYNRYGNPKNSFEMSIRSDRLKLAERYDARLTRLSTMKEAIYLPLIPYLLEDEEFHSLLVGASDYAYEKRLKEITENAFEPMVLLNVRESVFCALSEQYLLDFHNEMIHEKKSSATWNMLFREHYGKLSTHVFEGGNFSMDSIFQEEAGAAAKEKNEQKRKEKIEIANARIQLLLYLGVNKSLSDKELLAYAQQLKANQEELSKALDEMYATPGFEEYVQLATQCNAQAQMFEGDPRQQLKAVFAKEAMLGERKNMFVSGSDAFAQGIRTRLSDRLRTSMEIFRNSFVMQRAADTSRNATQRVAEQKKRGRALMRERMQENEKYLLLAKKNLSPVMAGQKVTKITAGNRKKLDVFRADMIKALKLNPNELAVQAAFESAAVYVLNGNLKITSGMFGNAVHNARLMHSEMCDGKSDATAQMKLLMLLAQMDNPFVVLRNAEATHIQNAVEERKSALTQFEQLQRLRLALPKDHCLDAYYEGECIRAIYAMTDTSLDAAQLNEQMSSAYRLVAMRIKMLDEISRLVAEHKGQILAEDDSEAAEKKLIYGLFDYFAPEFCDSKAILESDMIRTRLLQLMFDEQGVPVKLIMDAMMDDAGAMASIDSSQVSCERISIGDSMQRKEFEDRLLADKSRKSKALTKRYFELLPVEKVLFGHLVIAQGDKGYLEQSLSMKMVAGVESHGAVNDKDLSEHVLTNPEIADLYLKTRGVLAVSDYDKVYRILYTDGALDEAKFELTLDAINALHNQMIETNLDMTLLAGSGKESIQKLGKPLPEAAANLSGFQRAIAKLGEEDLRQKLTKKEKEKIETLLAKVESLGKYELHTLAILISDRTIHDKKVYHQAGSEDVVKAVNAKKREKMEALLADKESGELLTAEAPSSDFLTKALISACSYRITDERLILDEIKKADIMEADRVTRIDYKLLESALDLLERSR